MEISRWSGEANTTGPQFQKRPTAPEGRRKVECALRRAFHPAPHKAKKEESVRGAPAPPVPAPLPGRLFPCEAIRWFSPAAPRNTRLRPLHRRLHSGNPPRCEARHTSGVGGRSKGASAILLRNANSNRHALRSRKNRRARKAKMVITTMPHIAGRKNEMSVIRRSGTVPDRGASAKT